MINGNIQRNSVIVSLGGFEAKMMIYFGDVEPFLVENDVSPSYREKLLQILRDPEKYSLLQVVVIDVGEHFCESYLPFRGRWSISVFMF